MIAGHNLQINRGMKELLFEDIGKVRIVKSARARRISITLRPFKGVRVSIPNNVSYQYAEGVVKKKREWILKSMAKMEKAESGLTVFDEYTEFKTRWHRLKITRNPGVYPEVRIKNGVIALNVPDKVNIRQEEVQQYIRKCIEETLRYEAKSYLPQRVEQLAEQLGLEYNRVFIKNTKSRWGSCSSMNNINLSLHLMRLPDHLIDYIILHELAHLIHRNHGPGFWGFLDDVMGNARKLDREVNQYNLSIY